MLDRLKRALLGPRRVWLTFDDGPHESDTDSLLEILNRHGAKAVFFVCGEQVERHPKVLNRTVAAGHRVGVHCYRHVDLTTLGEPEIEADLRRCAALLAEGRGTVTLFRPPHGRRDARVRRVAAKLGFRTVLWDVDTHDWNHAFWPDAWVDLGADQVARRHKSVVLAHEGQPNTAAHFDRFLSELRRAGPLNFQDPFTL